MKSNPLVSYTLSPASFPHRIALSSAMIVATAPSIFSVDFSLAVKAISRILKINSVEDLYKLKPFEENSSINFNMILSAINP